uniref:Uncharacterized protein n=1 Tax=Zea mays TaxID=4577 RepID=A0A804MWN2_MAIZE
MWKVTAIELAWIVDTPPTWRASCRCFGSDRTPGVAPQGQHLTHDEALLSRDIHLLQLCTGIYEKSVGSSFQLVFAPIDEHFPDDAPLISSSFHVIPLDMKTDGVSSGRTLDLASSLDDSVATMAHQYVCSVVSAVQRVSMAISPSESGLNAGQRMLSGFPEAATLARWVCQSYHYHLGVETLFASGGIDHHSSL